MEPEEWIERFADRLGLEQPSPAEVEVLLELAGVAAHASARTAAPIACWLIGRSGRPPAEMFEDAKRAGADG